jgi:hypothetical protein
MLNLLRWGRWAGRTPDGRAVVRAVADILDQQHAIESRSYDARTGIMAVAAARRVLAALPVDRSGPRQIEAVLGAFEWLKDLQKANMGEYASGAATIGAILGAIRTRFQG